MERNLKQMKVNEPELKRLKIIRHDISRQLYSPGGTYQYSLGDCVEMLLDLYDEMTKGESEVEWRPGYTIASGKRIIVRHPQDEPEDHRSIYGDPTDI